MEEDEAYSYYLQDDLGSPMQLLDEEGLVMETYGFDEFGVELPTDNILEVNVNRTNNPTVTGLHNNNQQPFSFTGYQMDEAGEMYFAQARRYDAEAGRFVSEDRVKGSALNPITTNPYQYCRNQPFEFIDPTGDVYIIVWSYSTTDVEQFENFVFDYSLKNITTSDTSDAFALDLDGRTTDDWSEEMWDEFNKRCSFSRAAYTRYDELIEQGIPEDEIIIVRVDGKQDLIDKWNLWTKYDSVQCVEFYTHGYAGEPNMYLSSTGLFYNKVLPTLNWKATKDCPYPYMNFYGCNTIDGTSQIIADYYGVRISGNVLSANFSNSKYEYSRILEWDDDHNVYLGVYGVYDEGSIWINDSEVSQRMQKFIGIFWEGIYALCGRVIRSVKITD